MDQTRMYQMQQEQHEQATNQAAQVLDLKAKYLDKRIRASKLGMLTARHKKQYANQTGIVVGVLVGPTCGLEIAWEDGTTSNSLPYMVTLVEE